MLRLLCLIVCLSLPAIAGATQEPYRGPFPVSLAAADGTPVRARHHPGAGPLILLIAAPDGAAADADRIAFDLYAMGYSTLSLAAAPEASKALPHLEAALTWAKSQHGGRKVILWGSGASAAGALLLAAKHPDRVEAVLAFSPGEDLPGAPGAVAEAAARVRMPVFIMTPTAEKARIASLVAALATPTVHLLDAAVHGDAALSPNRCASSETHWGHVRKFLNHFKPLHLRK